MLKTKLILYRSIYLFSNRDTCKLHIRITSHPGILVCNPHRGHSTSGITLIPLAVRGNVCNSFGGGHYASVFFKVLI